MDWERLADRDCVSEGVTLRVPLPDIDSVEVRVPELEGEADALGVAVALGDDNCEADPDELGEYDWLAVPVTDAVPLRVIDMLGVRDADCVAACVLLDVTLGD